MRLVFFLAVTALALTSACTSDLSPRCPIDGSWSWDSNNNPGGSSPYLALASVGDSVVGVGSATGIGPSSVVDSVTVSGRYIPHAAVFGLTLSYRSGRIVTYAAGLVCPDKLQGTAQENSREYGLAFHRE